MRSIVCCIIYFEVNGEGSVKYKLFSMYAPSVLELLSSSIFLFLFVDRYQAINIEDKPPSDSNATRRELRWTFISNQF